MTYQSPLPTVEIPDGHLTPIVLRHVDRLANEPALVDGPSGRTLTYGQAQAGG